MNKKVFAIPVENEVLCSHFGHCQKFEIFETENNCIITHKKVVPPEHVPGLFPRWLAQFGVTDVIAGGMGQQAISIFNMQGINTFIGAPIKKPVELVNDFFENQLKLVANYCDQGKNHSHGGCKK